MVFESASGQTLTVRDGRVLCPVCQKGTLLQLLPDTHAEQLPVYCKRCRTHHVITITKEKN